jgi:riboflavin kinase/FMN adenylyltransferase
MAVRVARSLAEWRDSVRKPEQRTVLAIGNFDGVHLGHQAILRRVAEDAVRDRALPAAITFEPHPLKVLRPAGAPVLISTLEQRLQGLEQFGIEAVLVLPFDLELSRLSPEEFVKTILVDSLRISEICVGDSFRFGHRHAGDVRMLGELGGRYDYRVEIVPPVVRRGAVVSSSAIRIAVAAGRLDQAARLLGRAFSLTGTVQKGTGTGRRVVVPTLNLAFEQELLPPHGVYVTENFLGGRWYRSATNVGVRPTFNGDRLSVESNLLDFSAQVTGERMEVRFLKRLRAERKFPDPAALRAQITKDLERCRTFFRHVDRARRSKQTA